MVGLFHGKNMERPINMESIKMVGLFIWKNMERPKKTWMVYVMENPMKMDDNLGYPHDFLDGTPHDLVVSFKSWGYPKLSSLLGGFKMIYIYYIYIYIWVNYNDLTATSLEIMASKGNHPQMALIQVSEIL